MPEILVVFVVRFCHQHSLLGHLGYSAWKKCQVAASSSDRAIEAFTKAIPQMGVSTKGLRVEYAETTTVVGEGFVFPTYIPTHNLQFEDISPLFVEPTAQAPAEAEPAAATVEATPHLELVTQAAPAPTPAPSRIAAGH